MFVKNTTKSKEQIDNRSRGELLKTSRHHLWQTGSGTGSDDLLWHMKSSLLLCFRKCSVVCKDPKVQSTVGGFFKSQTHRQRWMFLRVLWRLDPGPGSPSSAHIHVPGASEQRDPSWWRLSHSFQVSGWEYWNYEISLCIAESYWISGLWDCILYTSHCKWMAEKMALSGIL